ncbi:MAG: hypothetical protein Q7V20_11945 [Aquabacterium sp.]|uniref:mechanosensitive ion channel family protein n=1 Tax=Aquabacterium sp. TaxID=1872578 RepID=UPI002718C4F5|nr:hypothetical protein [Aquabacterium sp.]MDO9004155.1 hypothetical protein [Aquabacterium sp.]
MERVDVYLEPVRAFLFELGAFLPRLGVAIVVMLLGILLAKAARFAIQRGLRAINFHILTKRSGMDSFLKKGGTLIDTVELFGLLAYWLVILIALVVAFNGLGLTHVTELLGRVMWFVPKVIVALLILAFGAYFARFVANAVYTYCENADIRDGDSLSRLARYAIMAFVVMIALDQMEVGGTIIRDAFLIVLGGIVLAIALAFGLGGREWAAARLEEWWPTSKRDKIP